MRVFVHQCRARRARAGQRDRARSAGRSCDARARRRAGRLAAADLRSEASGEGADHRRVRFHRRAADGRAGGSRTIRCAPRCATAGGARFPPASRSRCCPILRGTVDWAPLVAGMDAVVHLAGIAHVGPDIPDAIYDRVNHLATAELAGAAARPACSSLCSCPRRARRRAPHPMTPLTEIRRAAPDRRLRPLQARRRSGRARVRRARTRSCGPRWSTGRARRAIWRA